MDHIGLKTTKITCNKDDPRVVRRTTEPVQPYTSNGVQNIDRRLTLNVQINLHVW